MNKSDQDVDSGTEQGGQKKKGVVSRWSLKKIFGSILGLVVVLVLISVVAAIFIRVTSVTFVDNYEFGFTYDRFTGKIEAVNHTGWVIRMPIRYNVHSIDKRPYQVSISANSRILNAKLVQFNPEGLQKFVEWHGRSAGDDNKDLLEILKCYAFDRDGGRSCPFLTVVSEIAPDQSLVSTPKAVSP